MSDYFIERLNEEGSEQLSEEISLLEPRPEYVEGKIKLALTHEYSNSGVLHCTENDDGVAAITLTSPNKVIDFSEFTKGYKFVTPSFWLAHGYKKGFGNFEVDYKRQVVSLGDMRSARDLLSVLHEIGHLQNSSFTIIGGNSVELSKRNSQVEREAWADALNLCRKIKQQAGTDVLEVFKNFEDVKKYIYASLVTYRYSVEDPNTMDELRKYFDKGKFVRNK
jgi:hypothetical protein